MDTTRADALSCYSEDIGPSRWSTQTTPHLDAMASQGVLFRRFFAHAPTTLSSHTSMLTGRDPHQHTVVRNGFELPPMDSLATVLSGQGYQTIGVVGSSALERAMGLDAGFQIYDDQVSTLLSSGYQDPANRVVDRVLGHLEQTGDQPLFLFVHFYDAHAPYEPPAQDRAPFLPPEGPVALTDQDHFIPFAKATRRDLSRNEDIETATGWYLGEVHFVDRQIQRLMDELDKRALLDDTLVVITSDHGEILVDDTAHAFSHGSDIHHAVQHIPLIFWRKDGRIQAGRQVQRQASMDQLAPTLLDLLRVDEPLGYAPSFARWLRPGPVDDGDGWPRPTRSIFMEATRPRNAERSGQWNNLAMHRGVMAGGDGIQRVPYAGYGSWPYAWFSGESEPILTQILADWDALAPPYRQPKMSDETKAALKALGYLSAEEDH